MKSESLRVLPAGSSCTRILAALAVCLAAATSWAQEYKTGDIHIHHPFATPTRPGSNTGAAYFQGLSNRGAQADRLLRASSPVSGRIELHSGEIGGDGVMRMRELESLPLPPRTTIELGPGRGDHLMLVDLRKPLAEGDTFAMTLEFERAGKVEVKVVVQESKPAAGHSSGHRH